MLPNDGVNRGCADGEMNVVQGAKLPVIQRDARERQQIVTLWGGEFHISSTGCTASSGSY